MNVTSGRLTIGFDKFCPLVIHLVQVYKRELMCKCASDVGLMKTRSNHRAAMRVIRLAHFIPCIYCSIELLSCFPLSSFSIRRSVAITRHFSTPFSLCVSSSTYFTYRNSSSLWPHDSILRQNGRRARGRLSLRYECRRKAWRCEWSAISSVFEALTAKRGEGNI